MGCPCCQVDRTVCRNRVTYLLVIVSMFDALCCELCFTNIYPKIKNIAENRKWPILFTSKELLNSLNGDFQLISIAIHEQYYAYYWFYSRKKSEFVFPIDQQYVHVSHNIQVKLPFKLECYERDTNHKMLNFEINILVWYSAFATYASRTI